MELQTCLLFPDEVWQILKENGCSPVVQIAGLLHDCLEDAGITADEIEREFNKEIRELVELESEDKMRHLSEKDYWRARKQATINELQTASKETWYYSSIAKALEPISNMPMQQELCALINEFFV